MPNESAASDTKFKRMHVGAGDSRMVFIEGIVKPINAGNAKTACLLAAAPELYEALRTLADYAEAEARGDDSVPQHLRCISAAQMAEAIIGARAALARAVS